MGSCKISRLFSFLRTNAELQHATRVEAWVTWKLKFPFPRLRIHNRKSHKTLSITFYNVMYKTHSKSTNLPLLTSISSPPSPGAPTHFEKWSTGRQVSPLKPSVSFLFYPTLRHVFSMAIPTRYAYPIATLLGLDRRQLVECPFNDLEYNIYKTTGKFDGRR